MAGRLGVSVAVGCNGPRQRGHIKVAAMERLKRRSDFRAVAQASGAGARARGMRDQAMRAHASGFVLQARASGKAGPPRVGLTVSKQVGNAVERNRVRRRLRELMRLTPSAALCAGHDYVLIGRRAALKLGFDAMMKELGGALRRVHRAAKGDAGTGAVGELSPHRAGPSKRGGGKPPTGRRTGPVSTSME